MPEPVDALKDRRHVMSMARAWKTHDNPLAYLRGLLVPALMNRDTYSMIFGGRKTDTKQARDTIDQLLSLLSAARTDQEFIDTVIYLKENVL